MANFWHNYSDAFYQNRNYDLEIEEQPVRSPALAYQLWDIATNCSEAATCIDIINHDAWSSDDGDDIGFDIADTLNDNETKIDPQVEQILRRLIDEVLVFSGLERVGELMLTTGDAFASIGVNTSKKQIEKLLILPTWDMFRIEDNQANLKGFEQRAGLMEHATIHLHPIAVAHWRYRRWTLYGRALFRESLFDWCKLKSLVDAIENAAISVGVNPNIHTMPCDYDDEDAEAYRRNYERAKAKGVVTDFFMLNGGAVTKVASTNPDISALVEAAEFYLRRIVRRSRVPPWMIGFPSIGAREISGGPERAYARLINHFRQDLSVGIRHILNLELALHGIPKERWQYRLKWPVFYVAPYQEADIRLQSEANSQGVNDLDYISTLKVEDIQQQLKDILNNDQSFSIPK